MNWLKLIAGNKSLFKNLVRLIYILLCFRLILEHVLSEAKENWHGLRGRITKDLLTTSISKELEGTIYTKKDLFSCICGPNAFVDVSDSYLKELGFMNDQIHCFQG